MQQQKMTNLLNDIVVAQRNPLLVQLSITPLVNQFPYTLQVWIPEDKILDVSGYIEAFKSLILKIQRN